VLAALLAGAAALASVPGFTGVASAVGATTTASDTFPVAPPARICGDASVLTGPATAPAGAVVVPAGDNIDFFVKEGYKAAAAKGTVYYFATGTHTFGTNPYGQIVPADSTTYIGAPGAILDGQDVHYYAFTGKADGVTIKYLTIQHFVPYQDQAAVNHDLGPNWTVTNTTMRDMATIALNMGPNSLVRDSCLTKNGQTGINGTPGVRTVTIDHNEIGNNSDNPNGPDPFCGCHSGVKLFGVEDARITNNWVHDNAFRAIWGDTNAVGFLVEGNYINDNSYEAIVVETGYNAFIHNNNIIRNALVEGGIFSARQDSFPIAAVYLSESGGDSRVYGGKYATLVVSGNNFENNYGGITLWEDANRFCNTPGNTAAGFCPVAGGKATPQTCVAGTINAEPYLSDCRWRTQNVLVESNTFKIDKVALKCVGTRCGENSLFSQSGSSPPWSPYLGDAVKNAITFNQNNHFRNNTYIGDWEFDIFAQGNKVDWSTWRGAPYNQDAGSTLTGGAVTPPPAATPVSIWPDTQDATEADGGVPYTLGTRFTVATAGQISALRFDQTPGMDGPIGLKLWRATGPNTAVEIASASYTAVAGRSGWRNVALAAPVSVFPTERYVVTYHTPHSFAFGWSALQTARTVGDLTANANGAPVGYANALYRQESTHTFPTSGAGGHSYFADVVFTAGGAGAPPPPPPPPTAETLWADSQPVTEVDAGVPYTLGTRFVVSVAGGVTALRFYKTADMTGPITLKLWRATGPATGVELASVTYTAAAGESGWRDVALATPVALVTAERYVVSYHTPRSFALGYLALQSAHTSGHLTAPAGGDPVGYGNALYKGESGAHTFPAGDSGGQSYFADVVFRPGAVV